MSDCAAVVRDAPTGDEARGAVMALTAYGLWGLLPIYWKLLDAVPPLEILAHRVVWSLAFVAALLAATGGLARVRAHLREPAVRRALLASTALIATNWGLFIYAVSADRITDASLGYYVNPLLSIALGRVFLGERLRPLQLAAVGLAACGVIWLTAAKASLPWISLVLALTFGLYGLVRKRVAVSAVDGLAIETALTSPFALAYLALLTPALGHLRTSAPSTVALLVASGAVTAIPLLAFAGAARRLRLGTLGMVQYVAPTLQLACAVALYGEPFGRHEAITFGLIWSAVLLYAADALRHRARSPAPAS
ncbi:MAG: EamA family transporter RarD [Sandaracinaceae bacterium]|nr:EamA family transporter RarD [Sandaracinaceae bacterium]